MEIVPLTKTAYDKLVNRIRQLEQRYSHPAQAIKEDMLYTQKQAERILGVSRTTLTRYRNLGYIKFIQVGRSIRYRYQDVQEFMQRFQRKEEAQC